MTGRIRFRYSLVMLNHLLNWPVTYTELVIVGAVLLALGIWGSLLVESLLHEGPKEPR